MVHKKTYKCPIGPFMGICANLASKGESSLGIFVLVACYEFSVKHFYPNVFFFFCLKYLVNHCP